jgi:MATE family multidrug resistance protein
MSGRIRASFARHPRDGAIAALAIPALGTLAIDPIVTIVDTAWVARLGTVPLAALAVAGAVFAAVFSVFNFIQVAVTPLIAAEVGRRRLDRAGAVASGAVVIAVGLGIVCAIGFVILTPTIADLFGAAPDVGDAAATYLRIRFLALPMMLIASVGHGVYRGHHDTKTPLYVAVGMNVVNLVLDPVLIFWFDMGIAGAAWATVVAQSIAALWFIGLMFWRQRARLGIERMTTRLKGLPIVEVLAAGWPLIIRSMALLGVITATTVAVARIGTDQTAAHQVALQVWLFLAFVLDSYAIAAQAMVGSDVGAGDLPRARDISDRLLALGFITGAALSVLLFVTAPLVPVLFDLEPAVRTNLSAVYVFVVVTQPLTALVYVWDGIGIGATAFRYLAWSMVASAALAIATLVAFGDTLFGVWVALAVLTVARLVTLAGWYRWGKLASGRGSFHESQEVEG